MKILDESGKLTPRAQRIVTMPLNQIAKSPALVRELDRLVFALEQCDGGMRVADLRIALASNLSASRAAIRAAGGCDETPTQ